MKRPNRLYSLLESAIKIRGEYWLLPDGSLLHATDGGDHNHEGWVYEYIVNYYVDAANQTEWGRQIFGEDWAELNGYDYVMFRDTFANEVDAMGMDPDEADDEIEAILTKQFGAEQVKLFYKIVSNQIDAREFAIKYWKWIRIAFNNAELPDLTPQTLKRTGEGFCDVLYEETGEDEPDYETEVVVSTYQGDRLTVTLHDLLDGRSKPDTARHATYDDLTKAGRRAADTLDKEAQHPFYHGKHESAVTGNQSVKRMLDAFRLNGFNATHRGDHFLVSYKELGVDRYGRQAMIEKTDEVPADEWSVRNWLGLPH